MIFNQESNSIGRYEKCVLVSSTIFYFAETYVKKLWLN